jgi:hypothetical protein
MNIRNETKIEKKLTITETDMLNGGEALILIAYAVKDNDDLYSYPAPQIFNQEIYEKNKQAYDNAVREFRQACEVI